MLNDHGQPLNPAFCYAQNARKALQDLLGLLQGVMADQQISSDEALFLDTWLRNNEAIESDPDYQDLLELTTDILEDGICTAEELDDLQGLVQTILECRLGNGFSNDKEAMQRLLGICKGITADQSLGEAEILVLRSWLERSAFWTETPLGRGLRMAISDILRDGVITKLERHNLLELLSEVSGSDPSLGVTGGLSTGVFNNAISSVEFPGNFFCFTGQFNYGSRSLCQKATTELGGSIHKTVTAKTHYLVIGSLSSRDWAHTSYGRKIEKAVEYRERGKPIVILHEDLWCKYL